MLRDAELYANPQGVAQLSNCALDYITRSQFLVNFPMGRGVTVFVDRCVHGDQHSGNAGKFDRQVVCDRRARVALIIRKITKNSKRKDDNREARSAIRRKQGNRGSGRALYSDLGWRYYERLDRPGNFFKFERTKLLEGETKAILRVVAHWPRNANTAWRAFRLGPGRYVYRIAMQVRSVCNRIANVDANPEADSSIRRLLAIVERYLFLDLQGTPHRSINAVKHDEQ